MSHENNAHSATLRTLDQIIEDNRIHRNLDTSTLVARALDNGEGTLTNTGALSCFTGKHTGRSPLDKFIVEDESTKDSVDWGNVNRPMSPENFELLYQDQLAYLAGKELYLLDAYAGAENGEEVSIRTINESAWANLFCRQLFRRYETDAAIPANPRFTIVHTPSFSADPARHGTRSETFIVVNFEAGLIIIGGTEYAGEMKKSIFSVLNYVYPRKGILAMHCSANVSSEDSSHAALFFGLSGTGKTTLSADPTRQLIGDDEHGWSDRGIFNFEGGCYAKCINLSEQTEPQIWNALRDGAILENVVVDENSKVPNYDDSSITENTRAAYPVEHIEGALLSGVGPHPRDIVFLTCDAFGVMPPIARLSTDQAMYHFLSGYTAKVAGTEKGLGNEPEATFSACFGAPFLPLHPTAYAELLGKKIDEHKSNCWLVNTGWIGGGVGVGSRIKLQYTRRIVQAALNGELNNIEFGTTPVFGLSIPTSSPDVPSEILNPRNNWSNKNEFDVIAKQLAEKFVANFEKFASEAPHLVAAGPRAT